MELSIGTLIFLSIISLPVLVTLLSSKSTPNTKKRRPPGPWNLPLIGNLLRFLKSHPHVVLRDLANKYGPMMYLRIGQIDTIVISSPALAQEVFHEKDTCFATRPPVLASEIFFFGNRDLAFAPYGAYWRTLRKICTVELLSTKMVRQFAHVRNEETLSLIRKIQAASHRKEAVNLPKVLLSCTNSIAAKASFGHVCSAEHQDKFITALTTGLSLTGGFSFADLLPSLWFIDTVTGIKRLLWQARSNLDLVFDKIIAQCDAQRGDDLVSVLLGIRDKGGLEFPIDITNVKAMILDMFSGGTETTSSTAEWVMSELIRNPEKMAKAQDEVRQVFNNKSPQDHEANLDKLPYIKMVIKEAMRLNPVVPVLPRLCKETCDIGGFEVTEGTKVIVNTWAMARNPEYWHDAEKFLPERFEDGSVDYKASRFEYLPFGAGRRRCPGDTFGMALLELMVARLLYYFDWSPPDGMRIDEIDMDMLVGATTRKKNRLHLVASPYMEIPIKG